MIDLQHYLWTVSGQHFERPGWIVPGIGHSQARATMPDNQRPQELGEAATINIVAAVMVEQFGSRAAEVAADQLAAAHPGPIADRWYSIVISVHDRLNSRQTAAAPIPQSNIGAT